MPRPIVVERPEGRLGKMSRTPERVMTVMIKVTITICRGSLLRRVKKGSIFLRKTGVILIKFINVVQKERQSRDYDGMRMLRLEMVIKLDIDGNTNIYNIRNRLKTI
jgi:hypothetical protein